MGTCKQQEEALLDQLKDHSKADEAFVISASYILELAKRAHELFEGSQPAQKNRLMRFVFANADVQGEKLNYKLKNVFEGIAQCNKTKIWLPTLDALRQFDWGKLARDMQTVRGILGLEPAYG